MLFRSITTTCLLFLALSIPVFSHAIEAQNVLILHAYHHGFFWTDSIDRGLQKTLKSELRPVQTFTEYLDTKRFRPREQFSHMAGMLKEKYAGIKLSVIITTDDNALDFILQYRKTLFPGVPVVFCGVNNYNDERLGGQLNITGVAEDFDVPSTLSLALKLFPATSTVALVSDSTPSGRTNLRRTLGVRGRLANQVDFHLLSELTEEELAEGLRALPKDSIVLNLGFWRDRHGKALNHEQSLSLLSSNSPGPVFTFWDHMVKYGVVGGIVVNGEAQGTHAAKLANWILNGVDPTSLAVIRQSPNTPIFDLQALQKFKIDPDDLPENTIFLNPSDSWLVKYQKFVWPTIGLLFLETLLISLLLINIARRKRTELRLAAQEADFKKLIEASPIPLRVTRLGGEVVYLNRQFRDQFGYTLDDIPDMSRWFEVAYPDPDYRKEIKEFWEKNVEENTRFGTPIELREWCVQCKDGHTVEIAFGHTQLSELGVTTLFDVTRRNQALREREALEKKILHAQKMESLGVLAGGIAHDFNNLLTGILGGANLSLRRLPPESPVRERIEMIAKSAERAADLTRQMLAYSGKGHFVIETIDLNLVVDEMIHLLETVISKNAHLHINLAEITVPVEADATQLRQVIMNLITNASDALEERSGDVTITTGVMNASREYLAKSYVDDDLTEGAYAYFEVSDTGQGMSRETLDRIFDPFFTTKFSGRGLGLAAVLGIIRGHHGTVRIYSEQNKGTSFKVLLPCRSASDLDRREERCQETQTDLPDQCGAVLIVDDDATVRMVSQMMLEEIGFRTFIARDGIEGLEYLKTHNQEIGLVLLDLTMPKLSGEEVFREIRTHWPELKVILSSGYNEQDATAHFIGKGLAGFLHKPYRAEDLLAKISEVVSNKQQV